MRTVFEPSNALEGHMLQDLLKQRGISSRVDGAQLQGGVGELPVTGFIRLIVDDEDYDSARAIIDEWESTVVPDPIPVPRQKPSRGIFGAIVGLVLGVAGTYAFCRAPTNTEGIDYNEDGTLDERWEYSPSGTLVRSTLDRNLDGKIDAVYRYDRRGLAVFGDADDDFDGTMESHVQFHRGTIELTQIDTDGDSHVDLRSTFKHGVLLFEEHFSNGSESPFRIEHFRLGKIVAAEIDTNQDGQLDTRHEYSHDGGISRTEAMEPTN